MSRLDTAINRLVAQRDCLNWAMERTAGLDGVVLELGLGNGRTYDHLRQVAAGRRILVFERMVNAHPDCVPPDHDLLTGDFLDSLPRAARLVGAGAALAHADLGTGDKDASVALAARVAPVLVPLLRTGAIVVSDQPMTDPGLRELPRLPGIRDGRIFMFERI